MEKCIQIMEIIKAKFIKIESTHNRVRKEETDGWFYFWPKIGERFTFWSESIDENASVRYINTSEIKEFEQLYEKIFEIKTQNSTYRLEIE